MKAKVKLKTRMIIFLAFFALLFLAVVVFSIITVQKNVIITAHEKLKGDLAMGRSLLDAKHPGEWSIRDGKLFKGETQMNENFSIVDTIGELTSDTVTIFQGDTRVATNVKNASGVRAVGTKAAENVIEATLKKGGIYIGKANVVGTLNQTAYEPIKDARGSIIGMFYVGVPNTRYDEVVKDISTKVAVSSIVGLAVIFILGFYMVSSIVKPINQVIAGLSGSSSRVSAGSAQISSSSRNLAEGASQQASSLEETSSSVEELTSMTKQNAQNAEQANHMMDEAHRIVDKVNVNMQNMAQAIHDVTKSSEETGKIIKTIDEIAFQTNLLALNAAVEAARAGEAGAGFAVVAGEVRNLAMRASEAAKNTSSLIENTIKSVRKGNELTQQTREAFKENIEISGKIGSLVGEIAAASQEQARGIEQINKAVAEMDQVTQRTAASAEESARASGEMNAQAGEMKTFVEDLTLLVNGRTNGHVSENHELLSSKWTRMIHKNGKGLPAPKGAPVHGVLAQRTKVVRPEQVIPLEVEGEQFRAF